MEKCKTDMTSKSFVDFKKDNTPTVVCLCNAKIKAIP